MRAGKSFAAVIVAGVVCGCAGTAGATSRAVVTITLDPGPLMAGHTGRAFLMSQGDGTRVQIEVSGVPPLISSRPVQLYTFIYKGACGGLSATPSHALLDRVRANSPSSSSMARAGGPYTVSNTAPLPLATLREGNYAIVVRSSPADGDRDLFCGNVR